MVIVKVLVSIVVYTVLYWFGEVGIVAAVVLLFDNVVEYDGITLVFK